MALTKKHTDADLVKYVNACWEEADQAKRDREDQTEANYDAYHMKHDFSHKKEGQSRETLSNVRMSVESTKSFFQQALADVTDWFGIEYKDKTVDEEALPIKSHEAEAIAKWQLERANYFQHVGLSVQRALMGGVMTSKTYGEMIPKPKFVVRGEGKGKSYKKNVVKIEDKAWELRFKRIRNDDFFPDPDGTGLYLVEEMYEDLHVVKAMSKGDDAIYDPDVVAQLSRGFTEDAYHQFEKNRETGQDTQTQHSEFRSKVKLREYWGTIVSGDGDILYENVVMTVANDKYLIRKPTPNPLWHQGTPYVNTGLLEVDGAVWPIALMDAAVCHQHSMTELFNLIQDAAFKKVHAPGQIRPGFLENPEQVSDGIAPGTMLNVKNSLPPGAKVMEPLDPTDVPNDALNFYNMLRQEYNASSLSSDLRSGILPDRAVKATEVVEQSQSITSVFQGITKNIEQTHILREVQLAWMTICQNWDRLDKDELISMFGVERGTALSQLDPQDVFVQTVNGFKFRVSGITQTLSKAQDFRKLTTLLQTIGASELLIEEFIQKYDMGKLLGEIMTSLDIDKHKIKAMAQEGMPMPSQPQAPELPGMEEVGGMSQVPQAQGLPTTEPGLAELLGATAQSMGGPQ